MSDELFATHHRGGVRRALLWLRLSHCVHRDTQQIPREWGEPPKKPKAWEVQ
jgi:hypothetical protein